MNTEEMWVVLPASALRSATYEMADALGANAYYQQRGWMNGLPIVPPTEERVLACLRAADLAPEDLIGVEPVQQRPLTAEKVAITAVMAGCLPMDLRSHAMFLLEVSTAEGWTKLYDMWADGERPENFHNILDHGIWASRTLWSEPMMPPEAQAPDRAFCALQFRP
jgi:hypothetical protein